ncbi:MAG: radical SAM family heme chaperone HemW [Bacteroidota bacterium]
MAGIYLHIPFCKQACHYCDFHFSTVFRKREAMVMGLAHELRLRKSEFDNSVVETIYLGGGTPSVLKVAEIEYLISAVHESYAVGENVEITIEVNPDDMLPQYLESLAQSPINRLSIGIQSFYDEDLRLMNRSHDGAQAVSSVEGALDHFTNVSIDLIYGIQGMDNKRWVQNIEKALSFNIPHISSYALTVEPRTALKRYIDKAILPDVSDEQAHEQYHIMVELLESRGYINYETSNFGQPGFFSKNNSAYWKGENYLGIGPSAHSFNGEQRSWNVRSNIKYLKAISKGELPQEKEKLSTRDRYNEYVMTGLRTIWGVSLKKIREEFDPVYEKYLVKQANKYVREHLLFWDGEVLLTTKKGKFLADGIASDLFMIHLK